jgi:predicted transcriptional regulator
MPGEVLGPLERRVMTHLWRIGPSTVAEVVTELNVGAATPLAYTTVMTILGRLLDKGYVSRAKEGRGFRHAAAVDEADLPTAAAKREFQQLVERVGPATVAAFAADLADADPELIKRLREFATADEADDRS